ncbi:hypothetical protein BD413DRAFT_718059 [Trametes elegans]|nr:hypothetical protein BD413DRAFT_718059 [Trametes elegans]
MPLAAPPPTVDNFPIPVLPPVPIGPGIPLHVNPAEYAVVPPANPGGALLLTTQHPHISETIRNTFIRIEISLAFQNAFPDALTRARCINTALVESARDLGYGGLQRRLVSDISFTRMLSTLPSQRISTFRGTVKRNTDAHVAAFYSLAQGQCEAKINWLLHHLTYIYPAEFNRGNVPWSKPYQHSSVSSIIRATFFNGPLSFAARNVDQFTSVLPARADQKELPIAMLALVGAAMHASLTEWRTGVHKPAAFTGDTYVDAYNEHVLLLEGIKQKSPRAFHTMMHRLYQQASGFLPDHHAAAGQVNDALAQVNIDAMDVNSD